MKHIIVATAGHVDHGKTALIKALTGTDTDTLSDEKKRGISINLGFAVLPLGENVIAGIVDVPGHEHFIKNMLAGTCGLDSVLLTVAADEGVMPQTREHVAMLDLLGVQHGIIVLTKSDLVDTEWLALIAEDVRRELTGTFLATAPLIAVSAVTGQGLEDLKNCLQTQVQEISSKRVSRPFRLWIDRVFTVKGYGVVVTGTVLSGVLQENEDVRLLPSGATVRVRGIESYHAKAVQVEAGQRAAINLANVVKTSIGRGMFLTAVGCGQAATEWDCIADWLEPVKTGTRVRVHSGTGEFLARIHYFKDQGSGYIRLISEEPFPAVAGDRAIVRLYSPPRLLGAVTLTAPSRASRKLSASRKDLLDHVLIGGEDFVRALISDQNTPVLLSELQNLGGYLSSRELAAALRILVQQKSVVELGRYYIETKELIKQGEAARDLIAAHHRLYPAERGYPIATIRQQLGLKENVANLLLAYWQQSGLFVITEESLALPSHVIKLQDWRQGMQKKMETLIASQNALVCLDAAYLIEQLKLSDAEARQWLQLLIKEKKAFVVSGLVFPVQLRARLSKLLYGYFKDHTTMTAAQFRDLLATTRKIAIPLLEYLDKEHLTSRQGDIRIAGPKLKECNDIQ